MSQNEFTLSKESLVVVTDKQVSCDLSGEVVILNSGDGIYYGLNEVGARVWGMVQEPKSVGSIVSVIVEEYAVDPERCEKDVMDLLHNLLEKGLVDLRQHESGT